MSKTARLAGRLKEYSQNFNVASALLMGESHWENLAGGAMLRQ